jgi:hypothetical protein
MRKEPVRDDGRRLLPIRRLIPSRRSGSVVYEFAEFREISSLAPGFATHPFHRSHDLAYARRHEVAVRIPYHGGLTGWDARVEVVRNDLSRTTCTRHDPTGNRAMPNETRRFLRNRRTTDHTESGRSVVGFPPRSASSRTHGSPPGLGITGEDAEESRETKSRTPRLSVHT